MTDNATPVDVVLWGETQVGKTTTLASVLCRPPSWIDSSAPESVASISALTPLWVALKTNRLPQGTHEAKHYPVRRRDGRLLRFRDMRGGAAGGLDGDDLQALRSAAALMIFVSWPGGAYAKELDAAMNPLRVFRELQRPMVLVITKIDCFLTYEEAGIITLAPDPLHFSTMRASRSAEGGTLPREFIDFVSNFTARTTFPISVYGYREGSYPAHYPDEFGRLVPWEIQPLNVNRPFDHVVSELA